MAEKIAKKHSGAASKNVYRPYLACGILMAMILLFDLTVPLGAAVGVLYITPILFSLWFFQKELIILIAVVSTALVIFALLWQPEANEMWKVIFNRVIAIYAIWVTAVLGLKRKKIEQSREQAVREREKAMEDLRILRGFLPICASCKKIRDDKGYWTQIEQYIKDHSEAEFSHGICPECAQKLYPELDLKKK